VILLNSKHYRVSFYTNIILVLVTIVANYLLIPQYGIEGAAIASAGAIFFYNGVKFLYVKLKMKMTPFTLKTAVVLSLGIAALYISGLSDFGFDNLWISGTLKSLIYLALFVAPLLYFRVSEDIHQLIFNSKNGN